MTENIETTFLSLFGTSIPIVPLPGIGAMIRIPRAERLSAISSSRFLILEIRTPGAGTISYRVTVGPIVAFTLSILIPKFSSVSLIRFLFSTISSLVTLTSTVWSSSSSSGGRWYDDRSSVGSYSAFSISSSDKILSPGRRSTVISAELSIAVSCGTAATKSAPPADGTFPDATPDGLSAVSANGGTGSALNGLSVPSFRLTG